MRKGRAWGVSTCLAWCAVASIVLARTSAEFLTIETDIGGEPAGTIRVLTWNGGRPDVVEITEPDGSSRRMVLDQALFEVASWHEITTSLDGSVQGRLSKPLALGSTNYEVRSRVLPGNRIELLIHQEGAPEGQLRAVAPIPQDGDTVSASEIISPVILLFCGIAQRWARSECVETATYLCGLGNVDEVEFKGSCGQGTCSFVCK